MRVRKEKLRKRRSFFTILILFSFILSVLPGGMGNIRAEELSGEEPVETVELVAEVIWTGIPEEMTIPNTTVKLMSGENVVESIKITDGSLEVKFTPVAKFNDTGEEILYSVSQDPLENFTTAIRDFVIENTFVEPVVAAKVVEEPVVEEPVVEEPVVEEPVLEEPKVEEPKVEEPKVEEPVLEEPKVEEPKVEEPKVEEPVLEEPKVEEPKVEDPVIEEPKVEEPKVEEPMVEEPKEEDELVEPVNLYEPSGPDRIIPAYATSDVPVYGTLGEPEEKSALVLRSMAFPMMSAGVSSIISPTVPGQVTIDKYATPVPGLVNTWDIKLRVEGMDSQKSSDIVLVIDRSGSMAGSRLTGAKNAAKAFVEAMKNVPNTRIAIVSFASAYDGATTVSTNQSFLYSNVAANRTLLNTAIDSLVAKGGTNTQAGIRRAATLLESLTSTADLKNIVLLSDGEPTQSYVINNVNTKLEYYGVSETVEAGGGTYTTTVNYRTRSNLVAADYNNYNTTVGFGSAAYTRIGTTGSNFYSHGNSAIAQAGMFKNTIETGKQRTLWTVALETTTYGNQVLGSIASPGKAFTASTGDLNTIFLQIAGSISSAVRDAVVVDPMGPGFEIPAGGVVNASVGTAVYNSATRTINWNFGALTEPIPSVPNIKYAELTYRVHITPDILNISVANDQHLYPTNGNTEISYKDMDGVTQSKYFPIPMVNPIFLTVEKILLNPNGVEITNSPQNFLINVKSDTVAGAYAYDRTFSVIPDSSITTTELRLADQYTISENAPNYNVTIEVYNHTTTSWVTTNDFTVIAPGISTDSGQQDILIRVTNQEKVVNVVANKIWEGGPTPRPTVWFMLYRQIGEDGTAEPVPFNEIPGEDDIKQLVNGVTQVSWSGITQTNNLGQLYIFSVREVNSQGQPFTPAYYTKTENGLTVTNTYTLTTVVVSKVVTGNMGDKTKEFTFTVTLGQGAEFPELGTGYTINPNNPSEATFTLKHEEEVTLIVPIGATLTIVESDNVGYAVSINGIPVTDPELTVTVQSEGTSIEFTNTNNVIIDAGVALDSLPYMLVLVLMGAGGVAGLIWKRKQLNFD